jgi:hypothetical protein
VITSRLGTGAQSLRAVGYTRVRVSVYLTRGKKATLEEELGQPITDTLFIDERFEDKKQLTGVRFEHCTFANISFKGATLRDCHFKACVFEGCYFRETTLRDCHFPASRFVDCEFPKPSIFGCGFQYTRFRRTAPEFGLMEPNLPGEPNLCRDLCQNLATEAAALGHEREARRYRLRGIQEHEEFLRRGYRWSDDYSESHFPGLQRVLAFVALCWSRLNGWLWGHGEYIRRLLLNLLVLAFVLGPGLLYLFKDHLHGKASVDLGDCLALSVASVLNNSGTSGVSATGIGLAIVLTLTGSGLLFLGLFVTYLFRAVTRR